MVLVVFESEQLSRTEIQKQVQKLFDAKKVKPANAKDATEFTVQVAGAKGKEATLSAQVFSS